MNSVAAPAVARNFTERVSNLLERVDYRLVESDGIAGRFSPTYEPICAKGNHTYFYEKAFRLFATMPKNLDVRSDIDGASGRFVLVVLSRPSTPPAVELCRMCSG